VVEKSASSKRRTPNVPKSWVATLVSLIVGIGVGTTFGRSILDSAGIPESCVRTISRAERAIDTGTSVADDGQAALQAVKDLRIGEAGDLLAEVKRNALLLIDQAGRFNTVRQRCQADRK
jgi:hypothetical protein